MKLLHKPRKPSYIELRLSEIPKGIQFQIIPFTVALDKQLEIIKTFTHVRRCTENTLVFTDASGFNWYHAVFSIHTGFPKTLKVLQK